MDRSRSSSTPAKLESGNGGGGGSGLLAALPVHPEAVAMRAITISSSGAHSPKEHSAMHTNPNEGDKGAARMECDAEPTQPHRATDAALADAGGGAHGNLKMSPQPHAVTMQLLPLQPPPFQQQQQQQQQVNQQQPRQTSPPQLMQMQMPPPPPPSPPHQQQLHPMHPMFAKQPQSGQWQQQQQHQPQQIQQPPPQPHPQQPAHQQLSSHQQIQQAQQFQQTPSQPQSHPPQPSQHQQLSPRQHWPDPQLLYHQSQPLGQQSMFPPQSRPHEHLFGTPPVSAPRTLAAHQPSAGRPAAASAASSTAWIPDPQHTNSPRLMRGLGSPLAGSTAALSAIFRDSASQHSLLQSQELDGDPMQALALMGAHASHQVPILAQTIEVQPRGAGSTLPSLLPPSRRSSLSRFALETDEEDDHSQIHPAFGGQGGGGSMHILPHASLGHTTLSSTATTPTASTAIQTPSSAASSVPTSPMRNLHFFPSAPKVVTTLLPSPRMTSLQMAGRKAAAMREALRAAGHAADAAEEEGDADAEMSAGFTSGSSAPSSRPQSHKKNKRSLAAHAEAFSEQARKRKKSKKRSRPAQLGPAVVAEAAAAGGDAEEPLLARAASALERASRIGRRKSVPPVHYGDGADDFGSSSTRRRAATDPTGLAASAASDEEEELDQPPSPPKNKECEQCSKKHAGTYGGGRFCCAHCARHFSIVRRWDKKQGR